MDLMVDKLTKDIKAAGETENLEEDAYSATDKDDFMELVFWARITQQIMMDISKTDTLIGVGTKINF